MNMIREYRRIQPIALRDLCCENNFYTCGDNIDYEHLLFDLTNRDNLTTNDIIALATDIWKHSDIETLERLGIDIPCICHAISEKCVSIFLDDKEPFKIIHEIHI